MVTIRIPALPSGLLSNLLGLAGLVAVVVAVGALAGNWWWSILSGGVVAVAMSVIAQHNTRVAEDTAERDLMDAPTADIPRLKRSRPA